MSMRVWSVLGNGQRLDGGAMFGNVPRSMWQRWIEPDAVGRIPLACRSLLVEHQGRRILFETGIGAFFGPGMRERFGVEEPGHVLLEGLAVLGLGDRDIDAVVLSHLHFDHAGGLLAPYREGEAPRLLFDRARFVVSAAALERARHPHLRDRASFIGALPDLLAASGRLDVIEGEGVPAALGEGFRVRLSEGHTPGMLLTELCAPGGPIVFAADLIPGAAWVHLPVTMGYDRFPERLIEEKAALCEDLLGRGGRLFFTHDPAVALGRLERDERGRFAVADVRASLAGETG